MTRVNFSFDSETKECSITVDGQMLSSTEVSLCAHKDYSEYGYNSVEVFETMKTDDGGREAKTRRWAWDTSTNDISFTEEDSKFPSIDESLKSFLSKK